MNEVARTKKWLVRKWVFLSFTYFASIVGGLIGLWLTKTFGFFGTEITEPKLASAFMLFTLLPILLVVYVRLTDKMLHEGHPFLPHILYTAFTFAYALITAPHEALSFPSVLVPFLYPILAGYLCRESKLLRKTISEISDLIFAKEFLGKTLSMVGVGQVPFLVISEWHPIPINVIKEIGTVDDNQSRMDLQLRWTEEGVTTHEVYVISNIPPAPRGHRISLQIRIDDNKLATFSVEPPMVLAKGGSLLDVSPVVESTVVESAALERAAVKTVAVETVAVETEAVEPVIVEQGREETDCAESDASRDAVGNGK
ncbi:hypothetical protein KF707_20860 [Candidatus Obscuribacterales bacterium]|nr:hypothetical protein [Candidatus Obscuribacterales bacterium]